MKLNLFCKAGLLLFVSFAGVRNLQAQVLNASAQTTLKIKLDPLIDIKVNDPEVLLEFSTLSDYQDGVTTAKAKHLTVSSLLPYTLDLKADNATLKGTGDNAKTIDAGLVNVALPDNTTLGGTYSEISSLSTSDQHLILLGSPVLAKDIDVTYSIAGNSPDILGHPADTYSSTITYTISSL